MTRKVFLLVIIFVSSFLSSAQCAMCRAVLETNEDQGVAKSINDGIVYLMAIPYILVALIGIIIYKKFYSKKKIT